MDIDNITDSNLKIYYLDKKRFSMAYLPYAILYTILYFVILIPQIISFSMSTLKEHVVIFIVISIAYAAIILISILKIPSLYDGSYIEITGTETDIAKYDVFRSSYEAEYSIKRIIYMKRTPFSIIKRGEIDCRRSYFEGRPNIIDLKKKRLKIPS